MHKASAIAFLALTACSSSTLKPTGFDDKPAADNGFGDGNGTGGGGLGGTTTGNGDTANSAGCSEDAKQVYVVSEEYDLYKFEPEKLAFTKLGRLACPSGGASPNSMAVDRSGTAWVNYSDGHLFKVSTKDAKCTATTFQPGQSGLIKFGMAFTSNAAGSEEETLFVSGIQDSTFNDGGKGLAKIDLGSMKLTPVSDYNGDLAKKGAELTGTGDGRLYGFFTTIPNATLARIEKGSASTSENRALDGVFTGTAWAFSFWGGDFWFYTSSGEPSSVTRLHSKTGDLEVVVPDVGGFRIVGAGVSTCAPLTSGPR